MIPSKFLLDLTYKKCIQNTKIIKIYELLDTNLGNTEDGTYMTIHVEYKNYLKYYR